MKQEIELLASYWTLAGEAEPHSDREYSAFEFRDRVEAAARAGFKGFGIWHADLYHTLESRSLEEMKQILEASALDRKSTRLNSSHVSISYAVFCLKKKKK